MKILIISSVFPSPPNAGDKNRIYRFLEYLSRRHSVELVTTLVNGIDDPAEIEGLRRQVKTLRVVKINRRRIYAQAMLGPFRALPAVVSSYVNREMDRAVQKAVVTKPDVALLYQLRATLQTKRLQGIPTVLEYTDCLYLGYQEYATQASNLLAKAFYRYESRQLRKYEGWAGQAVKASTTTSEVDRQGLLAAGVNKIQVIQNGVVLPPVFKMNKDLSALFIGNPAYPPNRQALEFILDNVWPIVIKTFPQAKFYVVGRHQAGFEAKYCHHSGVIFTGLVEDLATIYDRVSVSLSPVFSGTGIRNKVLEAWAYGKIVIVTPKAVAGLPVENGREVVVVENAQVMSQALINVFQLPAEYDAMRQAGRSLVEKKFTWEAKAEELNQVLIRAAQV